jgi:hypothetical protein
MSKSLFIKVLNTKIVIKPGHLSLVIEISLLMTND